MCYDMAADRTEMNDLVQASPELAGRLATLWENWAEQTGVNYKKVR